MRFAVRLGNAGVRPNLNVGVSLIWSIRYCDIVLEREAPRTTMTTRSAYFAKFMAAWPAEFAPPTT
jgi:hypothetical protein